MLPLTGLDITNADCSTSSWIAWPTEFIVRSTPASLSISAPKLETKETRFFGKTGFLAFLAIAPCSSL
ncbi:MAG: hypothetical protein F6J93_06630 [Oscillatoria sp. SIO1A7]|nr:hypothetical protein [Oscillatoria sp. SIO1A7]